MRKEEIKTMEVSELSGMEWQGLTEQFCFKTLFAEKDFIKIYCEVYRVVPRYFSVKENDKVCITLFSFARGSDLLFPCHFMFTTIWENPSLGVINRNRAWDVLLSFLKSNFRNISFRLPVGFFDIRPFYWAGFTATHKHTYLKSLADLTYHPNIARIIHKNQKGYRFQKDLWSNEVESIMRRDMSALGFSNGFISQTLISFKQLFKNQHIMIASGYLNDKIIGCQVVMLDRLTNQAYLFFISKAHGHYKSGFPALLYHYIFTELRAEGFSMVDMIGANHSSIADFKSKFLPELQQFYEVRYVKNRVLLADATGKMKLAVKSLLKLLRLR